MHRFLKLSSVSIAVLIIGALVGCGTGSTSSNSGFSSTTGQISKTNAPNKVVTIGYIESLHTADQFLNAWTNRDWKSASSLVTSSLRNSESKQWVIGISNPQNWSYELTYAKHPNTKTFVYHVWLYQYYPSDPSSLIPSKRQKSLTLNVVKTHVNGQTKWLVNNIPS